MKRPMLTQQEAATACGVSRTTIRRCREAGDLPGAVSDETRGVAHPCGRPVGGRVSAERSRQPRCHRGFPVGTGDQHQDQEHGLDAPRRAEAHARMNTGWELL